MPATDSTVTEIKPCLFPGDAVAAHGGVPYTKFSKFGFQRLNRRD